MLPKKILIGALSCCAYDHRRALVRETWGSDCRRAGISHVFLCGCDRPLPDPDRSDIWVLSCPDAYQFLPQKTRQFCRDALKLPDWKWLLKCDDDSYVSIPRLLLYEPPGDYVGAEWKPSVGYASGAGYFLSRAAAQCLADNLKIPAGIEDRDVGIVLQRNGFTLTIDNEHIIPFASAARRGRLENRVIISHRMLLPDSPRINRDLWMACHTETGLDALAISDQWREPA
jgi:hypothetical protein